MAVVISCLVLWLSMFSSAFATSCRTGFTKGSQGTKCYFVMGVDHDSNKQSNFAANYFAASSGCQSIGAKLTKVCSDVELNDLVAIVKPLGNDIFWIDGNAVAKPGDAKEFYTSVGESLPYQKWGDGEPNNNKNKESCLSLYKNRNYLMNDADCTTAAPYICEQ